MNRRIDDASIRRVCRELLSQPGRTSGRALRRELKSRYQACGKTTRVFAIWREERNAIAEASYQSKHVGPPLPVDVQELQQRLMAAETEALQLKDRAERAEYREQAHQDHWSMEIDRLREQLRAQPRYAAVIRQLQEQITRLMGENAALRGGAVVSDTVR